MSLANRVAEALDRCHLAHYTRNVAVARAGIPGTYTVECKTTINGKQTTFVQLISEKDGDITDGELGYMAHRFERQAEDHVITLYRQGRLK